MLPEAVCKHCGKEINLLCEAGPFIHVGSLSVDCFESPVAEPVELERKNEDSD